MTDCHCPDCGGACVAGWLPDEAAEVLGRVAEQGAGSQNAAEGRTAILPRGDAEMVTQRDLLEVYGREMLRAFRVVDCDEGVPDE